jgi:sporulation protein YqfD
LNKDFNAGELLSPILGGLSYRLYHCRVVVEGIGQERAVNRIMAAGIDITGLHIADDITFSFICSYKDYRKTEKLLKGKYMVSVGESYGLVTAAGKAAKRSGLIAGIIVICLMLFVQQNVITEIDIEGHYKTDEDELRSFLSENGLHEGSLAASLDTEQIKAAVLAEFNDIRWINIDRQGSYVKVDLVEGSLESGSEENSIHDVVAAKSGYIEKLIVKEGYPLVKEGDYVEKGQVIISSFVPLKNTTYDTSRDNAARRADAQGTAEAYVIYKLSAEFEAGKYSEEEMTGIVEEKIREYIRENIPDYIKIHNKDLKFVQEENIIVCNVTLEVSENIAEQKENELAENGNEDHS